MGKQIINWLHGASTIMDVWPNTESKMRELYIDRSDMEALSKDWLNVGKDIKRATEDYEQKQKASS